ncbi:MAG TPA: hypothetical protein VGF67_10080 [Ktedonobacteraceae bacterium]
MNKSVPGYGPTWNPGKTVTWCPGPLRTLAVGTPDLLAGQISALFNIRRQQGTRVE